LLDGICAVSDVGGERVQWLESRWIGERLAEIPDASLFPLLDLGSSTLEFRTRVQPYIDSGIFAPLRARGGKVWHVDAKAAEGVDHAGDLLDADFVARLKGLGARSALVLSILQHVRDREALARSVLELVPAGGFILVSGPRRFPRHFDPIDTLFRPSIEDVHALFPGTELVARTILDAGNWRQWRAEERGGRSLSRYVARLCTPFYRPKKWHEVATEAPYLVRHIETYAVVLRRR
jgi:hypothetical protein